MRTLTKILSVAIKELRELLRRPLLVLTLVLGPLAIMVAFGIGSDARFPPPRVIIVVPPGQERPRLLRDYEREFQQSISIADYTSDEEHAREQLRRNRVDAVLILPPTPYETIARGEQAEIEVVYNEIDPARRWLIPDFIRSMASDINREIFLQGAREQRTALEDSSRELDLALRGLDTAISAVGRGNREDALRAVQGGAQGVANLERALELLGPQAEAIRLPVERARARLDQAEERLAQAEDVLATPDPRPPSEQLGLAQTRRDLARLQEALEQFTDVPPEVAISPLGVRPEYTARLRPDLVVFFAPVMLALLVQHTAVSLGALALVRERLANTFELYAIAPISPLQLLLGKYLAFVAFTLAIGGTMLVVLMGGLGVPVFGDWWRVALVVVLLALSSVGLGFTLSLLASSEQQAVQFAMLSLLGIVFFSGFALPLDGLRMPALVFSYSLPATYGGDLLQDIMLRGLPGSLTFLLILAGLAAGLFALSLGLLRWRTRAA